MVPQPTSTNDVNICSSAVEIKCYKAVQMDYFSSITNSKQISGQVKQMYTP